MDKPDDWRRTTLGAVLSEKPRNGYSPRCPMQPNDRWILSLGAVTEQGFNSDAVKPAPPGDERVSDFRLSAGDLLISRSNTRGRVGFAGVYAGNPRWCAYPDLLVRLVVDREQALPSYVESVLLSPAGRSYFESSARGTSESMVKINRSIIEGFEFVMPPLPEQRKIAAILSSVDEAIEKTQVVIDRAQAVKKGLMQELLTKGLPGRHKTFKQTEIGQIPESWEVGCLGDLSASCEYGLNAKLSSDSGGIPVLRMGNLQGGRVVLRRLKYLDWSAFDRDDLLLRTNDILFNRTNSIDLVGKVGLFVGDGRKVSFASYLLRLRVNDRAMAEWLAQLLHSSPVRRDLRALATQGVSQANINRTKLLGYRIPIPPIEEQKGIAARLSGLDETIDQERNCCAALQRLKSALMSVLLTGELRVRPDPEPA